MTMYLGDYSLIRPVRGPELTVHHVAIRLYPDLRPSVIICH